ncbi:ABC transporter ATP-binding protein [Cellulomonas wangsupingiae]|uniref:ABC transporter ATP-binding protein n=1 Tax=Cellulomonas wangsupingiae TaxID=2968085 RepID=UPI001D0EB0AC|nr:ABC transporter ATP-binding protein [Cellulomonas wangsupingiae]MCM0640948.1 ABC transporter ATP-binding protein [Cellulomonas wangsupingiae]
MSTIRTERLTCTYGSGAAAVHALRGVDLQAAPGELLVVRGRSGSGKSTLLHALGGLVRPTSGTVHLDGTDLTALGEAELLRVRREQIAYVFQTFGLLPVLSAAENVEVPLRLLELDPAQREARVAAAIDAVGLTRHAAQRPDELSGGQQQRVAIARALATRPQVLLADEPTGQLDSQNALSVVGLLLELAHEHGVTTVVTTHDPAVADRADRVVELRSGVLAAAARA